MTNIIIIFNSFFEYGFLRKSSSSSSLGKSSYSEEWADADDSNQLGKIEHYWEYVSTQFTDLDSVRFINFYYEEATTNREKALGWILLAINTKEELKNVLIEIFSNIPILQLYSKEESYLWANRKEILESCDWIYVKNMNNPCPLLDNFIEYGKKKEQKKTSLQLMGFFDDRQGTDGEKTEEFKTPTNAELLEELKV